MELEYVKIQNFNPRERTACPFNTGCSCDAYARRSCYRCGFNPTVAKSRMEKLLKEDRRG